MLPQKISNPRVQTYLRDFVFLLCFKPLSRSLGNDSRFSSGEAVLLVLPEPRTPATPLPGQPTLRCPAPPSLPRRQGGKAPVRCPGRAAASALHRGGLGGREGARCPAGPRSPPAPKAPSATAPNQTGGREQQGHTRGMHRGGCMEGDAWGGGMHGVGGMHGGSPSPTAALCPPPPPQHPSHPKVVSVARSPCRAWRRKAGGEQPLSCVGESHPSARETALSTASAQTN